MSIKIAIDGPAGAGKSSVAKKLSADTGFIYVDTGALYRSIALYCIENNLDSEEDITASLDKINVKLAFIDGAQHVLLNDKDVSSEIRTSEVSLGASKVSAIGSVRKFLFNLQRNIAEENNCIMDGRDIGTVVLPNADLKIYLTASVESRAERRWLEMKEKGSTEDIESIKKDIEQRDYQDMHREIAPLKKADDAILVDTSDMNFEESVAFLKNLIKEKTGI